MKELKTLKDIQIIGPDGVEDSEYVKGLLRAEAVKWVKELDKDRTDFNGILLGKIKASVLIDFFNLTEVDLK